MHHLASSQAPNLLSSVSIEVTPKTFNKSSLSRLPSGTTVYIAHLAGTPIENMISTARQLYDAGMVPKPHIPARLISDKAELSEWLARYRDEAGTAAALLIAGGQQVAKGPFKSSIQIAETGLMDDFGFVDLSFAGHPEGNRDIEPQSSTTLADSALVWKQEFSQRTDAKVSLVTQFVFSAETITDWQKRLKALGIALPIHVGISGPASLRTLIRYGLMCGIGSSLQVIQRRAADLRKLLLPYTPDDLIHPLQKSVMAQPESQIVGIHIFPLGGLEATLAWLEMQRGDKFFQTRPPLA